MAKQSNSPPRKAGFVAIPEGATIEEHLRGVRRIINRAQILESSQDDKKDLKRRVRQMGKDLAAYVARQIHMHHKKFSGSQQFTFPT
jgi:hypothetical protein